MNILFAFTFSLLLFDLTRGELQRVILSDPTALCLDGSPGIYYIAKGSDTKTVVIYFEGGGWCGDKDLSSTIQNCYQRSKGYYGTTKNDPPTLNVLQGIYSNNSNNHYKDATRIFLRYCDGSGHQGTRSVPIDYKGQKLYFRGQNITIAQLTDIDKKNNIFSQAQTIIVTGGSAGGLASFLWADYIKDKASTKNVYCAPDSGIFLDSAIFNTNQHLYSLEFQNLFKLSNAQVNPPVSQCVKEYPGAAYKCMMAQYMAKFIKTPIFVIQSLYDSWSVPNILKIQCMVNNSLAHCTQQEKDYIEEYHRNTTKLINQISNKPGNGAWGVGCIIHGFVHSAAYYSPNYRIPMNTGNSIDATLSNWVNDSKGNHIFIDQLPWPANQPCAGTPHSIQQSLVQQFLRKQ